MAFLFHFCALVGFILAFGIPESRSSDPTNQWKTYVDTTGGSPNIVVTCEGATFSSNSNFEGAASLCSDSAENVYIKSATYGRTNTIQGPATYCDFTQPDFNWFGGTGICGASVTQVFVDECKKSTVNGACNVTVSNGAFGNGIPHWDPCPGIYKYLYLEYECSSYNIVGYAKLI